MEKQKKLPETFIQRMRLIVKKVGNAAKLARLSDMSGAVIGKYLAGDSDPSRTRLLALAEAANVNIEWLATGKGPVGQDSSSTVSEGEMKDAGGRPGALVQGDECSFIPFFKLLQSDEADKTHERIGSWRVLELNKIWLDTEFGLSSKDLFLFAIKGNDMEPTLKAGEIALIDRTQNVVRRDGIYVIRLDDTVMVKRIQRLPGEVLEIISDNPAYKAFSVNLKKAKDDFQSLGSVIWAWGGRRV